MTTTNSDGVSLVPAARSVPLVAGDTPAMREWAEQLVARARAEGVELTGDDGLLTAMIRQVLQTDGVQPEQIAALAAALRILQVTDLRASLPRIAQPALILHGERDAIAPLAAGQYLQRSLPRAALEVFAGAAHAPFMLKPQLTARRIMEFCGEQ